MNVELIPGFCHKLHANYFFCTVLLGRFIEVILVSKVHIFLVLLDKLLSKKHFTSWYTLPILLQCLFLHLTHLKKNTADKMDKK